MHSGDYKFDHTPVDNWPTVFVAALVLGLLNAFLRPILIFLTLPVTILAGDVYSNPVATGTAVYFRSSAGVIQPSVFTNGDGQGSVSLISGNPQPFGAYAAAAYGNGYHFIVARTLGQGGVPVEDSILVLWTGLGSISGLTPQTFNIGNTGSQDFQFVVADGLGHPLASGTSISVAAVIPPPPPKNAPPARSMWTTTPRRPRSLS